ncbi:MAG: zinc dependent phospholipase C family protein [Gemmatimonadota bacterium]|nr:zinc dependent phospholipase C family protein [Gemmatimonadota bacterium]
MIGSLLVAIGWLIVAPEPVAAWGPATHVALGEAVLGSLYLVPPAIRAVLERYPLHFLYGSVAADISFAKKYVPEGRHCHNWEIGEEILSSAESEPLQAVGYGYLAHLAADTIAHNIFVPRQLLLTSTTQAIGHTYWEHRMDMHVGEEFLALARHIVMDHDHSEADELFDDVLSRTVFSFNTNRRIFRGMIRFQGHERWQRVFGQVLANSRYDLPNPTVDRYFEHAFEYVVGYLRGREASRAGHLDPVGDLNLKLAKKVRRRAMSDRSADHPEVLAEMADAFFQLPSEPLLFWPQIEDPQFASGISSEIAAGRTLPAFAEE